MSSSKHFINDPTKLVISSLKSLTLSNPSLVFDEKNKIIYRASNPKHENQVSVISGGGSGHEPSFAAFVGDGLLAASVSGTIFASPSTEQVRTAILGRVPKEKGVLVVVMNYTGDVLNFGMAVEKAKGLGVKLEMVIVGDDVGVGRQVSKKVGRRGVAGTCIVLKVAGALAAKG
jgi:dihydroxyacetone kinase